MMSRNRDALQYPRHFSVRLCTLALARLGRRPTKSVLALCKTVGLNDIWVILCQLAFGPAFFVDVLPFV